MTISESRGAQFRQLAHLFDNLVRGLGEQHGIVAAKRDRDIASGITRPAILLRLERHAGVGNGVETCCPVALELDARHLAVLAQAQVDVGAAHTNARKGMFDLRRPTEHVADAVGNRLGLGKGRTRRQLDANLTIVGVDGGLESQGQRLHQPRHAREHDDRQHQAERTHRNGFPPVRQRPVQQRHIPVHQRTFAVFGVTVRLEEIGCGHRRDQSGDRKAE
jgi:hypothetical protein